MTFSGGGGSGAAAYAGIGGITTIKALASNVASLQFATPGGVAFSVADTNRATVDYWEVIGSTGAIGLRVAGATGNNNGIITSKGSGYLSLQTNGFGSEVLRATHTASAVNFVLATGGVTGTGPTLSGQGSDTNVDLNLLTKGTGYLKVNNSYGTHLAVGSGSTTAPNAYAIISGDQYNRSIYGSSGGTVITAGGSNTIAVQTSSTAFTQLAITHTASAVNYVNITGAATGGAPSVIALGSDTNIPLSVSPKGNGILYLGGGQTRISSNGSNSLIVSGSSGNVNYIQISNAGTGFAPSYLARGGDANVGLTFGAFNDANIDFYASGDPNAGAGKLQVRIAPIASAVNYLQLNGSVTGQLALIQTAGSDASVGLELRLKGAPVGPGFRIANNNGANVCFSVQTSVSAPANYHQMQPANAGSSPNIAIAGSDTNIDMNLITKGSGVINLNTGAGTQVRIIDSGGTAVNRIHLQGQATGFLPVIASRGSDTNLGMSYSTQGTGPHDFYTAGTSFTQQFKVAHTASTVNYIQVSGAVTGSAPYLLANGSDADVPLVVTSKGAGTILFKTAGGAPTQLAVTHTASAQNYVNITGATLSNGPIISAQGAAGSIDLKLASKGYGGLLFYANETDLQFSIGLTFSPVNFFRVTGSTAGVGLVLTAQGSDTNIPVAIQPKGTGALQAQLTDSTATGGNARGANAIDWQTSRNAASQVASGSNSVVAGGSRNTASGSLTSVVGGFSNSATGYAATIVGGISHTAAGYYNFIGGGVANSGTSSTAVTSQNGTLASGSQFVTLTGSNASIKVGQYIVGAAIDTDTYVYGVGGTSLILSKPALAAGNVVLSFFTPHGVVVGGGNNTATGSYSFIGGGGDAGDSASKNVASGDWATISGGRTNTASNLYTVISGGSSNTASGQYSSVLGGGFNQALGFGSSVAGGYANYSNGTYSQVLSGQYGSARGIDANLVMSSNAPFGGTLGVSQAAILVLGAQTVDATATVLCTNTAAAGATNQVSLPNNSAYFFTGEVVAGVTGGGNTKGWTIQGVIKRGANAASTALVGTPTVTSSYADAGASTWTIAVTAETVYGGIKVTFTGQASTTIRTVAQIRTTEMTY